MSKHYYQLQFNGDFHPESCWCVGLGDEGVSNTAVCKVCPNYSHFLIFFFCYFLQITMLYSSTKHLLIVKA